MWSVCCFQWWDLLQKLKGEQIFYPELDQIRDMNGNLLLERKEFYICIYDDKEKVLDGQIGYTEYDFEPVILEGYAKTKRYEEAYKIELLMNNAGVSVKDRKVVTAANARAEETGHTAAAIELPDGTILTGKTSDLMGACSALLIKALKHLAGIDEDVLLITPNVIKPIQKLKVEYLGSRNPRLHMEEVLIALSSSSESNPLADQALRQLPNLRGSQAHISRMLSAADEKTFQKLGVMFTSEAK